MVLNTWLDVQKKWQALESIFVGSADIRVQLPEDSKRFDAINADFQVGLTEGSLISSAWESGAGKPPYHTLTSTFRACAPLLAAFGQPVGLPLRRQANYGLS